MMPSSSIVFEVFMVKVLVKIQTILRHNLCMCGVSLFIELQDEIFKTVSEYLKLINQSSDDFDGAKEIHFLILS